jgi:phosphoglycolate phosphatase-like HAD superfamily hydrolase
MQTTQFLIGVNSDGTAFDSMNRKHLRAFIKAALAEWPMRGEVAAQFKEIERHVNLFSPLRGINRFPGLLEVFERLKKIFPDAKNLPDLTDLRAYIASETTYSTNTLREYMLKHPSFELSKVLNWSNRANVLFSESSEGLMPFPGVKEALEEASKSARIAVISSAAKEELEKDWLYGDLMSYVDMMMSQENGSKAQQLRTAMACCGEEVAALMVGDTESDARAAEEVGARFYPIIPTREEACWKRFREEVLPAFLKGEYTQEDENKYYGELKSLMEAAT